MLSSRRWHRAAFLGGLASALYAALVLAWSLRRRLKSPSRHRSG
ncbi:hypothetical protein [Halorussus gelatinilyticus]|nr:hypothetical protein [Halorussus gelatinilyticus]